MKKMLAFLLFPFLAITAFGSITEPGKTMARRSLSRSFLSFIIAGQCLPVCFRRIPFVFLPSASLLRLLSRKKYATIFKII